MEGLRWLLLLFGLLVIAGVYFYSRRKSASPDADAVGSDRVTPSLDSIRLDGDLTVTDDDNGAEKATDESGGFVPDAPQKIVTVRIVAREKKSFAGDELVLNLRGIGLRHGKFGIFHRYDGSDDGKAVFSAASLVEPGSFDLQNIQAQEIPGISLFLVLPGPIDSVKAFDLMMAAARTLAQSLQGELLDESGSTLSIQRERYLREEVIQFQHSLSVS